MANASASRLSRPSERSSWIATERNESARTKSAAQNAAIPRSAARSARPSPPVGHRSSSPITGPLSSNDSVNPRTATRGSPSGTLISRAACTISRRTGSPGSRHQTRRAAPRRTAAASRDRCLAHPSPAGRASRGAARVRLARGAVVEHPSNRVRRERSLARSCIRATSDLICSTRLNRPNSYPSSAALNSRAAWSCGFELRATARSRPTIAVANAPRRRASTDVFQRGRDRLAPTVHGTGLQPPLDARAR